MNILALETSSRDGQVALKCGDQVLLRNTQAKSHSQVLLILIQELLTEANLDLEDIDCIAVNRGPGSFTGLRIGIAVTQGLAFAHNIPVVALSSLAILAEEVSYQRQTQDNALLLSTLDARMQQLYCAWYVLGAQKPCLLGSEKVLSPRDVLQLGVPFHGSKEQASNKPVNDKNTWQLDKTLAAALETQNIIFAGTGSAYEQLLPESIRPLLANNNYLNTQPTASSLLRLAEHYYTEGKTLSAMNLEPVYLRDKVTS